MPITKDLELPENTTDAVVVAGEVAAVVDAEAIRGEAPNNQLITSELL